MKINAQVNCLYVLAMGLVTLQLVAHVTLFHPMIITNGLNGSEPSSVIDTLLYSELLGTLEIICALLIFVYIHDYKLLKTRQQTGESAALDRAGLQYINQNFQLGTAIVHEDEDCGPPQMYQHALSQYTDSSFHDERQQFEHYQRDFVENIEGTPRRGEVFLKVSTLPHLPRLSHQDHREQVGLFARKDIPQWSLFYWMGDTHIIHDSERHLLSSTLKMNRRTLASFGEVSFFQGGDPQQHSGCGVLANFFWCHTHSTPSTLSPYWLLPSNYLGAANCVYVTTKKDGRLCSALLAFNALKADEQILMFTGHDQEVKAVERRVRLYKLLPILACCALGLTLVKCLLIW